MEDLEHIAFLLYWLCKFFICKSSVAMDSEFSYYVNAILTCHYHNLGALFLFVLYKSLFTMVYRLKNCESVGLVFDPL